MWFESSSSYPGDRLPRSPRRQMVVEARSGHELKMEVGLP